MSLRIAFAYTFSDQDWLGGRNYFANLFRATRSASSDVRLVLFTGRKTVTTLPDEIPELEVVRTAMIDRLHPLWFVRQLTKRLFDSDPLFARLLRKHRIDALSHGESLGKRAAVKAIGWLFDFQFMHLPAYWKPAQLARVRRRYEVSCRDCDALIVSSHAALADRESFAPNLATPTFVLQFVSNPVDFSELRRGPATAEKYGLPQQYFFLPNQFWRHKNHAVVIEALRLLAETGIRPTVVCTGNISDPRSPEHFQGLLAAAKAAGVADQFKVLGLVPYADMQALMADSVAVLNPSKFEGWSTTVEEAKTLGKPLLLSDLAVHLEQCPTGAQFFRPDDAQTLAQQMVSSLKTPGLNIDPQVLQQRHAARMSVFAEQYLDILAKVTGRKVKRRADI